RPDIILSDIIMPEKNGYEVCEFVKSHPEYKSIPVVLLTGTFEPFDPDRADKAGCDAVVTKPFESQSLIHKVEELIAQSRSAASAPAPAAPPPEPADSPWIDDPVSPSADNSPFSSASPEPFTHGADIFSAAQPPTPTMDMPFDSPAEPAFGGETRAFPRMTFDELQSMASTPSAAPEPEAAPESSPWDEQSDLSAGGETRAFPRMTFDEMQQMANAATPAAQPEPDESPFGAPPPPEEFSGETRAFPRMSFEELQQMASSSAPAAPEPPSVEPEPAPIAEDSAPWDEQPVLGGGETQAFPRMTFDELQSLASTPAPELQQMAPAPAAAPEPQHQPVEEEPWEEPVTASWSPMPEETPLVEEATPFEPEPDAFPSAVNNQLTGFEHITDLEQITGLEAKASPTEVNSQITDAAEPEPHAFPTAVNSQITDSVDTADVNSQITDVNPQITDLTDEQIDRIARRVVQLMSDQVVRNIAWEVIPDLAEIVVKERIRQLEAE
ncbi:MAG TPA: response regulator, partial [Thermoanaerobaculia bacterium]|nr:response regulator [Thermoanaerobaculia bacterium]